MMADLLLLEPALAARLKQMLAGLTPAVHVLSADDLADVAEEKQLVPAVHLVYHNYRVLESRSDGSAARIEQTWLAVVTTRNLRTSNASGTATRKQAGPLAALVLRGLMGWRAPDTAGPLRLTSGPAGGVHNGFGYLPLAFAVEIALTP